MNRLLGGILCGENSKEPLSNDLIQRLLVVEEARVQGQSETSRQEQALENIFWGFPVW